VGCNISKRDNRVKIQVPVASYRSGSFRGKLQCREGRIVLLTRGQDFVLEARAAFANHVSG